MANLYTKLSGVRTSYQNYLRSEHWRELRLKVLKRADWRCERCGIRQKTAFWLYGNGLHIHHKHYRTVGREELPDVIALCTGCHESVEQAKHDAPDGTPIPMSIHPRRIFQGWAGKDFYCNQCRQYVEVQHEGSRSAPPELSFYPPDCYDLSVHTEDSICG